MKPVTALSLVVIAVLATVVIEETRIKKLQAEIIALRALRAPAASAPAAPIPAPAAPAAPMGDETVAPPSAPAPVSPAPAAVPPRHLPAEYPDPDLTRIQQLAVGDRASLYLEFGLTSREQAYLEDLIAEWKLGRTRLCGQWLGADEASRPAIMESIQQAEEGATATLRAFFGNDEEFNRMLQHLAAQPERELVRQMTPLMDAKGIALERAKEEQLIEALFRLRDVVGDIDWSSPAALEFIAAGTARDRFSASWEQTQKALPQLLATFLTTEEAAAVIEARASLHDGLLESLPPASAQ